MILHLVVKLTTSKPNNNGIQLTSIEWTELLGFKDLILNYFECGNDVQYQNLKSDHNMILNNVRGKKLLTLSWHTNEFIVVLDMASAQTLFSIKDVILHYMQMLSNLDFFKYYDKILTAANDCKIIYINYSDQQCIETVLDSNLDLHVLAFKELLYV